MKKHLIIISLFIFFACQQKQSKPVEIEEIKDIIEEIEPIVNLDTLKCLNKGGDQDSADSALIKKVFSGNIRKIEFFNSDKKKLNEFFKHLRSAIHEKKMVRIMHFGDSQVLRDRGTKQLRKNFQKSFGGNGPGLQIVGNYYEGFPHRTINRECSSNWNYYSNFLHANPNVPHTNYGLMAMFSTFTKMEDSLVSDTLHHAWVSYSKSKIAYNYASIFNQIRLFYGNVSTPVEIKIYADGELLKTDSLKYVKGIGTYNFTFKKCVDNVKFEFASKRSPEFYGLSLDGYSGAAVDNIGLIGSSGTFFYRTDPSGLITMFNELDPELIILQFGGNSVPGMSSDKGVDYYRYAMRNQIRSIQKFRPNTPIVFIGPSDMEYQPDSVQWVQYPYLEKIIDGLKLSCKETGTYYWDFYRAMGGPGSMKVWNEAGLAMNDHIHLYQTGIEKIMDMFYDALMVEYQEYLESEKK